MAKISLNAQEFWTPEGAGITMEVVPVLSEPFRLHGTQSRQDNTKVNRYIYDNWAEMGLGWNLARRESGRGVSGFEDADAETAFPSVITLPFLNQPETHSAGGGDEHLRAYAHAGGELFALFNLTNTDGALGAVGCFKYGGTSDDWTTGNTNLTNIAPHADDSARAFDLVTHQSLLFAGFGFDDASAGTERYYLRSSPDGVTFTDRMGSGFPTADLITTARLSRENFADRLMSILDFGNTLLIAVHEDPDSDDGTIQQIKIYHSTNAAGSATWTNTANVGTNNPHCLLRLWQDPFTSGFPSIPVLVTSEGVYKINIAGTSADLIYPLTGVAEDGLAADRALGNGNFYVSTGDGDVIELSIRGVGAVGFRNIGPATQNDGLVTARQGHANFIYGSHPRWLFVAYGGHASSKNASILRYDLFRDAWHSFFRDDTANEDIHVLVGSAEDDGTPRLHAAIENATGDTLIMFEEPFVSPLSGATQSFKANGFITWAEDDLGDPHLDAAVLQAFADVGNLSASAASTETFIELEYGLNGTTATTVSNIGNFVSGDKRLFFGKTNQNITGQAEAGTPIGVSAKKVQVNLHLNRGSTATTSPFLKEFELQARNKVATLKRFRVPIDIAETAKRLGGTNTTETVINRLITIMDAVTLVAFVTGEDGSNDLITYYVELVPPFDAQLRFTGPLARGENKTQRSGFVSLVLEEVLN
jgi:hypothetical protein